MPRNAQDPVGHYYKLIDDQETLNRLQRVEVELAALKISVNGLLWAVTAILLGAGFGVLAFLYWPS